LSVFVILQRRVSARFKQNVHNPRVSLGCCTHKRGGAARVAGIDIHLILVEQSAENGLIFGVVQRGGPRGSRRVHICARPKESVLRALLNQNEVNINSRDTRGTTALMSAASKGNARVVDILLKAGADATLKNYKGETALKITENEKCKELIQLQAKI
jgi:ankyrin repeat protein